MKKILCILFLGALGGLSSLWAIGEGQEGFDEQLLAAVKQGDLGRATHWLDQGANVDAVDAVGRTPLIFAAENQNEELAELLINRGADVHTERTVRHAMGNARVTPLHLAAYHCNIRIMHLLLDALINKLAALDKDDTETAPRIFDIRYIINQLNDLPETGLTLLHLAMQVGSYELVARLLEEAKRFYSEDAFRLFVHVTSQCGDTALHYLLRRVDGGDGDKLDIVNLLLEAGAHGAAASNTALVRLLLNSQRHSDDESIVKILLREDSRNDFPLLLGVAIRGSRATLFRALLDAGVALFGEDYVYECLNTPDEKNETLLFELITRATLASLDQVADYQGIINALFEYGFSRETLELRSGKYNSGPTCWELALFKALNVNSADLSMEALKAVFSLELCRLILTDAESGIDWSDLDFADKPTQSALSLLKQLLTISSDRAANAISAKTLNFYRDVLGRVQNSEALLALFEDGVNIVLSDSIEASKKDKDIFKLLNNLKKSNSVDFLEKLSDRKKVKNLVKVLAALRVSVEEWGFRKHRNRAKNARNVVEVVDANSAAANEHPRPSDEDGEQEEPPRKVRKVKESLLDEFNRASDDDDGDDCIYTETEIVDVDYLVDRDDNGLVRLMRGADLSYGEHWRDYLPRGYGGGSY